MSRGWRITRTALCCALIAQNIAISNMLPESTGKSIIHFVCGSLLGLIIHIWTVP